MLSLRKLGFLLVTVLAGVAAIGCGHSAQRIACTDHCQTEHDQCILHATSADLIERCDLETDACLKNCQQY